MRADEDDPAHNGAARMPVNPSQGGSAGLCIACGGRPRRRFDLKPGLPLWQCPCCLLGWWDFPAFEPGDFYDRDYFQSPEDHRGFDDYAALEPGIRRMARARLKVLRSLLTAADAGRLSASVDGNAESGPIRSADSRPNGVASAERSGLGQARQPDAAAGPREVPRAAPRLLDLGCGTGCFLEEAQRAGWRVEGVEVSAYAAEVAAGRGQMVRNEPLETLQLPQASFDAITLWDVLEHVRDPRAVLRMARRALRPGGLLALSTGDAASLCARICGPRWHLYNLPEHLFFFSPGSIVRLLESVGLQVLRVRREVHWMPFRYLLERLEKTALSPARRAAWRRMREAARLSRAVPAPGGSAAGRRLSSMFRSDWVAPVTLLDVLGVYGRTGGAGHGG